MIHSHRKEFDVFGILQTGNKLFLCLIEQLTPICMKLLMAQNNAVHGFGNALGYYEHKAENRLSYASTITLSPAPTEDQHHPPKVGAKCLFLQAEHLNSKAPNLRRKAGKVNLGVTIRLQHRHCSRTHATHCWPALQPYSLLFSAHIRPWRISPINHVPYAINSRE